MRKLTLEDLEAMRQHYGIAQEHLLEDLGQVGVLEEVGISLQRWAQLRDVPMEYALALREYPRDVNSISGEQIPPVQRPHRTLRPGVLVLGISRSNG
jgi:hypothetical protein